MSTGSSAHDISKCAAWFCPSPHLESRMQILMLVLFSFKLALFSFKLALTSFKFYILDLKF